MFARKLFFECGADVEQADDEKKDALWICSDLIDTHPYTTIKNHPSTHVTSPQRTLAGDEAHGVRERTNIK